MAYEASVEDYSYVHMEEGELRQELRPEVVEVLEVVEKLEELAEVVKVVEVVENLDKLEKEECLKPVAQGQEDPQDRHVG